MAAAVYFACSPSFTNITLADSADVTEAVRHILELRKRQDPDNRISKTIAQQTGSNTVGELRKLSDQEWRSLDIPALARILLKHLIRQAARIPSHHISTSGVGFSQLGVPETKGGKEVSFMEQLANDFNYGVAFEFAPYQQNLATLMGMGFRKEDAMEALVMNENKSIESALEVLFLADPAARRKKREAAKERLNRMLPNGGSGAASSSSSASASSSPTAMFSPTSQEITELRRQLEGERINRVRTEMELKAQQAQIKLAAYKEYVRGLIADEIITLGSFEAMNRYREEHKVTEDEHKQALKELNITEEDFERYKKFGASKETECVVCLAKPKDHVIFNCMHLCLCEDCAPTFDKRTQKCPLCSKKVAQIRRIYT